MAERMEVMAPGDPGAQGKLALGVAKVCNSIVKKTALEIEGRRYVRVEGWQAIANGFNCTAQSRDVVEVVDSDGTFRGFKAIGEVRRNSDGHLISQAEGFVGVDETRWFGGTATVWDKEARQRVTKEFKPAPEYAQRGMCQTRAISRACRQAFAFVVVMIDEDLDTTPAEEVEGADHDPTGREAKVVRPADGPEERSDEPTAKPWGDVLCSYGKKDGPLRGKRLKDLQPKNLEFLCDKFLAMDPNEVEAKDREMVTALRTWNALRGPR